MSKLSKYERGNRLFEQLTDAEEIYARTHWKYIKESDFNELEQVIKALTDIVKDIEYKGMD